MSVERRLEELTPLQNAVFLLKQAQARLAACERAQSEPIAVVGMACRFPGGAADLRAFWRLLCEGREGVTEVPPERWDVDEYYDPDPGAPSKMNTRWGGFLERVDEFDAEFFGISPREAIRVDPQQRLLLEVTWEALEDAGIAPGRIAQSQTGVYVGVVGSDYAFLQSRDTSDLDIFSGTGVSHAILANRLSYVLNLSGPSLTLDTACSSSLVTVHLACQSLRRRESNLALAGGVNLILSPEMTMALSRAHMMSADGRCKTFDSAADGYVRGEGCGMVVLKRLSDALADGDRIAAVIRGSAVNHDGRSNGLSAPSGPAQEAVIRSALADAGIAPGDINYIEAHGTGTRLGDPIEIEALRNVLCVERPGDRPLLVGSVKTNIGHLESAAGIAGLIKVVLMLGHGRIPAHLHLKTVNPMLRLDEAPMAIPTTMCVWANGFGPRRAGVSAFGFGGTNAHVILEESAAPPALPDPERPRHLLTLSARSPQALSELASRFAEQLDSDSAGRLLDLAHTANAGREHFDHRAAVTASSLPELRQNLANLARNTEAAGIHRGHLQSDRPPKIAFLFTGQGAQYAGMGRALYLSQPTFRTALDSCAELLRPHLDRPLMSLLEHEAGALLDQTGYTQPVMFAIEYALATLWRSWGIEPAAVLGHSVGEFAAACIAGVFSLEEGLRLIAVRARLMQSLPAGGLMAAIFAGEARVAAAIQSYQGLITIAALNGPQSIVVSGDEPAVRQMLSQLAGEGIKSKILATSHAFHSHRMDPILDELRQVAASVTYAAPKISIIANLTGKVADQATFSDPTYFSRHARAAVRFAESMQALAECGCEMFLEIGPSPTLIGMGRHCLEEGPWAWLPSLRPGRDDWQTLLDSLSQFYVRGAKINWDGFDRDYRPRKVDLPAYPFQRKRYWSAGATAPSDAALPLSHRSGRLLHPLLGRRVVAASQDQIFESQLAANRPALLGDHKVQGIVVMPGAGYLEMVLAASAMAHGKPWNVCGAMLIEPLLLDKTPKTVQTILSPDGPNSASFRIVSVTQTEPEADPTFTTLATGRLEAPRDAAAGPVDVAAVCSGYTNEPRDEQWQVDALRKSGLEPGPTFLWSSRHWFNETTGLAELRPAREGDRVDEYQFHPGLLDGGFQMLGALLPGAGEGIDAYVPMGVERIHFYESPREAAWIGAELKSLTGNVALGDIQVLDSAGRVLVKLEGVRLRKVPRDWLARRIAGPLPDWCYELAWTPKPLESAPEDQTTVEADCWLVFDSRDGMGADLAARLEMKGQSTTLVPGDVDPEQRQAAVREFLANAAVGRPGVVYLSGLDLDGRDDSPDFEAARCHGWGGVLDVLHVLADFNGNASGQVKGHGVGANGVATNGGSTNGAASNGTATNGAATHGAGLNVVKAQPAAPRVWLVTRGAQAVGEHPQPVSLTQSPIWGLARVIAAELPDMACTRIDLDPEKNQEAPDQLAEELLWGHREDQVAYRGGLRHVARLRRWKHGAAGTLQAPEGQPYCLEITTRGQLDNVALRPVTRGRPGPGQVEIRVRATGLNFRDVLNVLDLYPGDPGPMGGECAGEVTAIGPGVEHFKVGDAVVGLAPASFATYVLTLAEFVAPKPEHLSFEEAATIPICFLTVQHALRRLGQIRAGERILIHAATGGVGLAAIQIARQTGAEIFATAGSPRKREYLQGLGITHVMDSRSLDFQEQIMQATHGEGIDLVVNSLTGDAIAAGLSVLRTGGRFLELGKTDLWDQKRVDEFRPGVTFFPIALDHMMADEPATVGALMREVLPQFAGNKLEALPVRVYRIERMVDSLRHMARAEHIGKVVIQAAVQTESADRGLALREDGTYLVTGGLGGLGLKVARWLADRGARNLVLVGRSGASADARRHVEELEKAGVRVAVRSANVADRSEVNGLLADIRSEFPPLRGIFHLAGVLDDGILRELTRERFDRVMGAKALGAWNLHELTRDEPLDLFVLFSSAASLLGSPGQGNYAAANAFLDALAHQRRWEKLPALSVNWGAWAEVGMAARLSAADGRRLSAAGLGAIEPGRGLRTLEQLITDGSAQTGVLPIDWAKFFERIPAGSEPAWLTDVARDARSAAPPDNARAELLEELQKATPGERLELALTHIRKQAARVLAIDEANLPDPRRTLNELGFDSLTGVEFVNRVGRSVGQQFNPALLFDYPTLEALSGYVVRDLLHLECDAAATTEPAEAEGEDRTAAAAAVQEMSEEGLDALVSKQLEQLQA